MLGGLFIYIVERIVRFIRSLQQVVIIKVCVSLPPPPPSLQYSSPPNCSLILVLSLPFPTFPSPSSPISSLLCLLSLPFYHCLSPHGPPLLITPP